LTGNAADRHEYLGNSNFACDFKRPARDFFIVRRPLQIMALLLPLLTGGCATHALWTEAHLDDWNEPAANHGLQLFDASRNNDFLVVYDEYSERHDATRVRAYFLNQNETRVEQGRKPCFVSTQLSRDLPPVPVMPALPLADTNFLPALYAVISTNKQSFTIYSGNGRTSHDLPVYNDGWGRADRIALTPVAVVADLTIVGGFLFLECWSEGGLDDVTINTK
jgi:hypothetical protein